MTQEEFEKIVQEGIGEIPDKFLEKLENVAVCVQDDPTKEQLSKTERKRGETLLGLYEGVPQTGRGNYGQVLPDKITIFKNPIERIVQFPEEIKEIVKNTVWHEIAHHFGMDEKRVRMAERKRRRKNID